MNKILCYVWCKNDIDSLFYLKYVILNDFEFFFLTTKLIKILKRLKSDQVTTFDAHFSPSSRLD